MKAKLNSQITIKAAPAEIFKYLTGLKYHYLWNPQIQDISPITTLKMGSVYKTTSTVLGVKIQATNEVTKFVANKQIDFENKTGQVAYHASFVLKPDGDKTQVVCDTTVFSDGKAFAFAAPVLKAFGQRELQSDLRSLKVAVEHKLT